MEEKKEHFTRPTMTRPPSLFNLTVLAVVFGVLAGFGGYLLARTLLPITNLDYFDLLNNQQDIKINLEQPLTNVASKYQHSIAGIYQPVQAINIVGQPLFDENQFLGSAVVITSDGWLMTTDQVGFNKQSVVILNDGLYSIEDLREDNFSGAVFIKIDASSLQPVDFQLADNIKAGELLFANIDMPHNLNHSFYTTAMANPHYVAKQYLSTDSIDYYLQISTNDQVEDSLLATPYFNISGDLLGLSYKVNNEMVLLPDQYLKQAIKHLLNNTERVSLGLRYVDMENNDGFMRKGNLVFSPNLSAVVYNSPAYKAGLKLGDQIVAVNNDVISANNSLTSIIQNYRQGDVVTLKISRDGIEQDIEVEL